MPHSRPPGAPRLPPAVARIRASPWRPPRTRGWRGVPAAGSPGRSRRPDPIRATRNSRCSEHRALPTASTEGSSPAARNGHDFGVVSQACGYPCRTYGQPRERRRPCAPRGQSRSPGTAPGAPDRRDRAPGLPDQAMAATYAGRAIGSARERSPTEPGSCSPTLPQSRTTRSRRASWRRRSDSCFGLADSQSGSAAPRPASATWRAKRRSSWKMRATSGRDSSAGATHSALICSTSSRHVEKESLVAG